MRQPQPNDHFYRGVPFYTGCHREYKATRYLAGLSYNELARRLKDVMNNMMLLTNNGKIGIVTEFTPALYWARKFAHVHQEFRYRGDSHFGIALEGHNFPLPTYPRAPRGHGLLPHHLRSGEAVKYGKAKWLQAMLESGEFILRAASYYSDPSLNAAVQDNELSLTIYRKARQPIMPSDGHVISLDRQTLQAPTDFYTICLSTSLQPRLVPDFEADACLIIRVGVVLRQLVEHVRTHLPEWSLEVGFIEYIDPLDPIEDEPTIPFTKNFRYAYQREIRIAIFPPAPVQKLEDMKVCLGGLGPARLIHFDEQPR